MKNIEGVWDGYYEYGSGYALPFFGERVKVTFEILTINDQGEFEGICGEESSQFSVKQESKIKGICIDDTISFVKTYPVFTQLIDEEKFESENFDREQEVIYEGVFNNELKTIYGMWDVSTFVHDENGEFEYICSGIWLMKLKS